jgi:putative phosphoribosyl transferase
VTAPLFQDRAEAGRALATELLPERSPQLVIVGLARGGVVVAAEVARVLEAPLDVVAVRKVGHPQQPEYAIGAVTPGGAVYVRATDGLTAEHLAATVATTTAEAAALDSRLHGSFPAISLEGRTAVLVDDGLATGATMVAAVRWARAAAAVRVVVAVPVAASASLDLLRREADTVVSLYFLKRFDSVGACYRSFQQVDDAEVVGLLEQHRRERAQL